MKLKQTILGFTMTLGLLTPHLAHAQEATSTALGEVSTFGELISLIWSYGSQVIIAMAIFFVILGAFFYVASAGNQERINQGKEMVFGALVAIVIVMLSGVLIRTLHKPAEGSTGALSDVPNVINNASNILIGIIGTFAIVMLIYAGILYMVAGGSAERLDKARNAFKYGIFGLIVGVLAFAIANAVINFLT